MADQFNILDQNWLYSDLLVSGEEAVPRRLVLATNLTMSTQLLRVTYFTARKTETISQVKMVSGGTAAAATPTLVRIGIWTADLDGGLLSQVAATPNDTALLASTSTAYTKALSASFTKQAGQRYGIGLLVVTAAAAPTMQASVPQLLAAEGKIQPALGTSVGSQADLPASAAAGTLNAASNQVYFVLLP